MKALLVTNPSIAGPKIHFGNQSVVHNAPGVFADTPAMIPGAVNESWNIIEWFQQQIINPQAVTLNAPVTYDAALGTVARYSWSTADGETAVRAYDTGANGWVYGLASAGTTTDPSEHDVFLSTAQNLTVNMGGNEVDYSMNARIVSEGNDPTQPKNDSVYAAAMTGFVFNYNLAGYPDYDPSQPTFSVFLQIPLSSTQNNSSLLSYFSESTNAAGKPTSIISNQLRSENALLPTSGSATTRETYNLTAYVVDLASYLAVQQKLGAGVSDLARWTLNGLYTGVMTQGALTHVDLQVSDIELTRAATPSTAAQQINGSGFVGPKINVVVANGGFGSARVSDDGAGHLQIATFGSAPVISKLSAGDFVLPGGGKGYFDPSGNGEDVARMFESALGRHPDAQAVSFYTAPIDSGTMGLTDIAWAFLTSPEYLAKYAGESNASFAAHMLQNATGASTAASDAAWTALLNAGVSKAAVLVDIATSPGAVFHNEDWTGSNLYGQDYRAFETVLGRAPDASAQAWMANMVANGMAPQGIISALMDSGEMTTRYAGQTTTAIVEGFYQNGLGRAPDPAGLANAIASLQSNGSVVTLACGISQSAEARNLYADATHANWLALP